MAAFEVIALDTATPQLRAPGASDTYTFPRAVEMPLNTANGVLYLDGSKVVTSGSALTFDGTNLGVGGTATALGTYRGAEFAGTTATTGGFLRMRTSDSSINSLDFTDSNGRAIFTTTNHPLRFGVNDAEQMRLTSTGLGIGTSSPGSRLNVVGGSVTLSGTASFNSEIFQEASAKRGLIFGYETASQVGIIAGHTNGNPSNLAFWTFSGSAWGERMRLDSSGNLGLGVTPSAWFSEGKAVQVGSGAFLLGTTTASQMILGANYFFNGSNNIYIASQAASYYQQSSGVHSWGIAPSGTAGNAISFSQVMTLDASGRLGIGITLPNAPLEVLSASTGNTIQTAASLYYPNNTGGGGSGVRLDFAANNSGSGRAVYSSIWSLIQSNSAHSGDLVFGTANSGTVAERARITSGGSLVVGTAALATTATDGFLYVPTCAGTPTGTPTTQTGTAPIVVDTTNNKLYFYSGGQWRDAGP